MNVNSNGAVQTAHSHRLITTYVVNLQNLKPQAVLDNSAGWFVSELVVNPKIGLGALLAVFMSLFVFSCAVLIMLSFS